MNTAIVLTPPAAALVSSRVFPVLLGGKGRVEAGLVMLGKRAARKGLVPLTWSWGKPTTRREHVAQGFPCADMPGGIPCPVISCGMPGGIEGSEGAGAGAGAFST